MAVLSRLGLAVLAATLTTILSPSGFFPAASADSSEASEHTPAEDDEQSPTLTLDYRLWGIGGNDGSAARQDLPGHASGGLIYQRLRGGVSGEVGGFRGVLEADFLTGSLAGSPALATPAAARTGTSAERRVLDGYANIVDPRQAYVRYRNSSFGQIDVGLQTSDWGLGILANDGAIESDRLFNHTYGGDRVFRATFATAPFAKTGSKFGENFLVAAGGDLVYRDEQASLQNGDRAGQAVLALLYRGEDLRGGHYLTYRSQSDVDGDSLSALALDYYLEYTWKPSEELELRAGAETAFLFGHTNRTTSPTTGEPVDVRGIGAAGEFEIGYRPAHLRLRLRGGYASGDGNLEDGTVRRFRFDPNYKVGLVLFDHFMPAISTASYRRIHDPTRSAEPPKGAVEFVNPGSVSNALYLNPNLLIGREDGLLTGIGFLWARAAQPVLDPYESFANGGAPTGISGKSPAGRDLGWEVDVAARYRYQPFESLTFEAKAEYGLLFPGSAFESADGASAPPENLVRASLAAMW